MEGHHSSNVPARRGCAHRDLGGRAREARRGPRRKATAHPEGAPRLVLSVIFPPLPCITNSRTKLCFPPKSSTATPWPIVSTSIINKHHWRGRITAAASIPRSFQALQSSIPDFDHVWRKLATACYRKRDIEHLDPSAPEQHQLGAIQYALEPPTRLFIQGV
jgi:hypothetical protein